MDQDRIVAIALLTERDLHLLEPTLTHIWPLEESIGFEDLLRSIDRAEQHCNKLAMPLLKGRR